VTRRCLLQGNVPGAQLLHPDYLKIEKPPPHGSQAKHEFRLNLLTRWFKKIFLPVDYPASVQGNYMPFVSYTAGQIFFSHMSRVLATQAMLLAVGVGTRETVPMAAVTAWVMKDGIGHLVAIVVGTLINQRFDSDPKRFRFQAAALGKFADSISILTLQWPQYFVPLSALGGAFGRLSISTGGNSRAKVYETFARLGNLGDIMRCSTAQVTAANLLGTGLGACLGQLLGSELWLLLCGSTLLSLASMSCCYRATCFVQLASLNYQRAELVLHPAVQQICQFHHQGIEPFGQPLKVPAVAEIKDHEVFVMPYRSKIPGRVEVNPNMTSTHLLLTPASELSDAKHVLGACRSPRSFSTGPVLALWYHLEATPQDVLRGFLQAHLLRVLEGDKVASCTAGDEQLVELNSVAARLASLWWPTVLQALQAEGWRTDVVFLDDKEKRISIE